MPWDFRSSDFAPTRIGAAIIYGFYFLSLGAFGLLALGPAILVRHDATSQPIYITVSAPSHPWIELKSGIGYRLFIVQLFIWDLQVIAFIFGTNPYLHFGVSLIEAMNTTVLLYAFFYLFFRLIWAGATLKNISATESIFHDVRFGPAAIVSLFLFVPALFWAKRASIPTFTRVLYRLNKRFCFRQRAKPRLSALMRKCAHPSMPLSRAEIDLAFTVAFEQCVQNGQQ